jgi:hypothetical protein
MGTIMDSLFIAADEQTRKEERSGGLLERCSPDWQRVSAPNGNPRFIAGVSMDNTYQQRVTPSLLNTAGEPEAELRSRRANTLEAFLVAAGVMTVLWPFCFACGVLADNATIQRLAQIPVGLFIVWALIVSPFWHGDTLQSLGLGNPLRLFSMLRARRPWLLTLLLVLFGSLFMVSIANWPDTAKVFRLGSEARLWPLSSDGSVKMTVFSAAVSAFVVTCVIRYDNLRSALRIALMISGALILYAGSAAVLHRGWTVFSVIDPARYPLDVIAYVFWGGLQQFVFTAYFSTRLRKGIRPSVDERNLVPVQERTRRVLVGGLISAFTIAPALWLTVRAMYGAAAASFSLLVSLAAFALPVGAIWTHFYCKDKRRLIVAALAGSFFGLIHIDSYGLVLATFALGTVLAYVFMEDRFRNLSALALIHGFLGSTFGKLFRSEAAGSLRVDYKVGPWNVENPSAWMLIIPLLCLAVYAMLLLWALRHRGPVFEDTTASSEPKASPCAIPETPPDGQDVSFPSPPTSARY